MPRHSAGNGIGYHGNRKGDQRDADRGDQYGIVTQLPPRLGLQNQFGLILVYTAFALGQGVFLFVAYYKSIPLELEEAAIIDGCSTSGTFFRIVFPLAKLVLVRNRYFNNVCDSHKILLPIVTLSFDVLWIWNDFMLPLLMLSKSQGYCGYKQADQDIEIDRLIIGFVIVAGNRIAHGGDQNGDQGHGFQYNFKTQYSFNYTMAFTAYLLSMLPIVAVYCAGQKYIIQRLTAGAVKG